jgi:hypothetical protein
MLRLGGNMVNKPESKENKVKKIKCDICGDNISSDELLNHLSCVHKIDVMRHMRLWKTYRGLGLIFLIFWIGFILGMTFIGVVS